MGGLRQPKRNHPSPERYLRRQRFKKPRSTTLTRQKWTLSTLYPNILQFCHVIVLLRTNGQKRP